ncbi:hypothetical protein BGZ82_001531 [Podila clonocystis]|nr:hypothetical protein BGZ82_001531 [Podila clonocystis]
MHVKIVIERLTKANLIINKDKYVNGKRVDPNKLANIDDWAPPTTEYNFKVVYRPGALNVLPDALSRQFPQELWTEKIAGTAPKKRHPKDNST